VVAALRTPDAVRERAAEVLRSGERGELRHFSLRLDRLGAVADYVVGDVRANYPDLLIPYHSRWRHFGAGGVDRGAMLAAALGDTSPAESARARMDLVVVSVLLDAGAGARWKFHEPGTDVSYSRSEGLAIASFHMFLSGALSSRQSSKLIADAGGLQNIDRETLMSALQVSPSNPLVGVEGRVHLMNALGRTLRAKPEIFGQTLPRIGNLYDYIVERADDGAISARDLLITVLGAFSELWSGRMKLGGENLGDVWRHPAVRRSDASDSLMPLHKLSQWLTYSLLEPLEWAGIRVFDLNALTGLAEYRNGGLFMDLGVLAPRDPSGMSKVQEVGSELVVEWRALTVALLDRLAPLVRQRLGMDDESLPLAKILQGGTWSAGRKIAAELRADGEPPIRVKSDGTVF
jgi:hypothetical protein